MHGNSRLHLSRSKGRPLGVRERLAASVCALRPSEGCPETPLSSRAAALLPEPAQGALSPEPDRLKLFPILPFASREAECGTSLGRCSDTSRLLAGAGMGSSEAVAHAVLLDTAWLQWELVTLQLPRPHCWLWVLSAPSCSLPIHVGAWTGGENRNCSPGPFSESKS